MHDDELTVTVGGVDRDLAARSSQELDEVDTRATGVDDQRGLSVQVPRLHPGPGVLVHLPGAGLHQRHGYAEFGRTEGLPIPGSADLHRVTALTPGPGRRER